MLPQQAQAFRAVVQRHFGGGDKDDKAPAFTDLIAAEQAVVTVTTAYLTTLQAYWQATSDLASLLQTDDVYQMAVEVQSHPMPDLAELLKLPCCHPCASQPQPAANATLNFESPPGQPDHATDAPRMPATLPTMLPARLGQPTTVMPVVAGRKL
jgi:hypothetical protein